MSIFESIKDHKRRRKEDAILIRITNHVGLCSAGIANIFNEEYNVPNKDLIMLENAGLLLARIHFEGGLNEDEIMRGIALFHFHNCKYGGQKYLEFILGSFGFYDKIFFRFKERDLCSAVMPPIICYNLIRPGTWKEYVSVKDVDMLKMIKWWTGLKDIILKTLPIGINPLLDQLDEIK